MLDFRHDRIDYGRMLIPPEGYNLERAIAATYSLDLNTLLSIPVALFYSQTLEGELTGERFQILEAIRRTADCVTVYCQKGHIHVPPRYNRLFAFMEDMVVPVPPKNAFMSFHPKVWAIRYVDNSRDTQVIYRVLILTRNLTFDRCWDLAVCLEGKPGTSKREVNEPLIDFLTYLNAISPIEEFRPFARDLAKAKLNPPRSFDRIAFHPIGINGYLKSPITSVVADEGLCMSPFMDGELVADMRKRISGDFWIFGRKQEMAKLSADVIKSCRAYSISDQIVEGESRIDSDDTSEESLEQDLHAKLFIFQQPDRNRWYIGSANATNAAAKRNIEFLVELIGYNRYSTLKQTLQDLQSQDGCSDVFEEFSPEQAGQSDIDADRRKDIRRLEFNLIHAHLRGSLTQSENQTNYDLLVMLNLTGITALKEISLCIKPLNCTEPMEAKFGCKNNLIFRNIKETEISRFIVFRIKEGDDTLRSFVARYTLDGMPASRLDSIFKSIVSNKEKFLEYLAFLLAGEVSKSDFSHDKSDRKHASYGRDDDFIWNTELPIFERLVAIASRDPMRLKAIDNLIDRLKAQDFADEPLMPPNFLDFWEVFRPLVPSTERKNGNHVK
ncbi:MAG: phospholipase D family protein [Acidobacteria bacterium]|nr:phospholipase D family protein [Acidobacteriota bacterium]